MDLDLVLIGGDAVMEWWIRWTWFGVVDKVACLSHVGWVPENSGNELIHHAVELFSGSSGSSGSPSGCDEEVLVILIGFARKIEPEFACEVGSEQFAWPACSSGVVGVASNQRTGVGCLLSIARVVGIITVGHDFLGSPKSWEVPSCCYSPGNSSWVGGT